MKAGEMSLCWGCECHQTAHQVGCAHGESDTALGCVLVELVGELAKTALGDGPARAIPAQALEADARCELARGNPQRALERIERALVAAPGDARLKAAQSRLRESLPR